jgi:hypothetical protein
VSQNRAAVQRCCSPFMKRTPKLERAEISICCGKIRKSFLYDVTHMAQIEDDVCESARDDEASWNSFAFARLPATLPQAKSPRPRWPRVEHRVSKNHFVSHCREIVLSRQVRNPGKLRNTVHCNYCTVRPGSASAAQVAPRQNPKRGLKRSCPNGEEQ